MTENMTENISIGQVLATTTGEFVKIIKIENEFIFIRYKDKIYKREKSIIGKKLFLFINSNERLRVKAVKTRPKDRNVTVKKSCLNCMEMRKGDCFGQKDICEFYRYSPTMSEAEKENWPTRCSGPY